MLFCSNCGNSLNEDVKFCPNCGTAIPEKDPTPAPATPVYEAPVYEVPAVPVVSTKAKVLGYIGMGLAIGGLVLAVIGLIYTFFGMAIGEKVGFVFSFVFGCGSFPLSIVGGVLCNNSIHMGNHSAPCSVGTKLRVAGIIVSAAMLFFGFLSLID